MFSLTLYHISINVNAEHSNSAICIFRSAFAGSESEEMFQPSQNRWRRVRAHSARNRTVNAASRRRPDYRKSVVHFGGRCDDAGPPSGDAGRHGNRHDATCVTSSRSSRDGLRHRNGKFRELSRNATPEPPFSSAERATVDSTDYTSGLDAVKPVS